MQGASAKPSASPSDASGGAGSSELRAALVGCGRIGAFTRPELRDRLGPNWLPISHAEALAHLRNVAFVACCDPDAGALARAADTFGAPARYTELAMLLQNEKIDILSVATRSDVRPAIIREAIRRGVRGIHSEKPLALSLRVALDLVAEMQAAGTRFSYGALRRYMPVFRRVRDLAADGSIGNLRTVTARFGAGGLLWTHPHAVDLLCFLAGDQPVVWVQANLDLDAGDVDGKLVRIDPPVLSATILFANGVVGQIVPDDSRMIDIGGTEQGISVLGDGALVMRRGYQRTSGGADIRPTLEPDTTDKSGRLLALEDLRDAILDGRPQAISLSQVANQHRILFAMLQSHLDGGRRTTLEDTDTALTIAPVGQPAP
jgi:scyllo-inositol 2-dehydrogenase (NAD+)